MMHGQKNIKLLPLLFTWTFVHWRHRRFFLARLTLPPPALCVSNKPEPWAMRGYLEAQSENIWALHTVVSEYPEV